jgi:hypothetical protein
MPEIVFAARLALAAVTPWVLDASSATAGPILPVPIEVAGAVELADIEVGLDDFLLRIPVRQVTQCPAIDNCASVGGVIEITPNGDLIPDVTSTSDFTIYDYGAGTLTWFAEWTVNGHQMFGQFIAPVESTVSIYRNTISPGLVISIAEDQGSCCFYPKAQDFFETGFGVFDSALADFLGVLPSTGPGELVTLAVEFTGDPDDPLRIGSFDVANLTIASTAVEPMPEPTVLGLTTLGATGLALRRRKLLPPPS